MTLHKLPVSLITSQNLSRLLIVCSFFFFVVKIVSFCQSGQNRLFTSCCCINIPHLRLFPIEKKNTTLMVHSLGPVVDDADKNRSILTLLRPGLQIQCLPRREEIRSIHIWMIQRFEEFQKLAEFKEFAITSFCCAIWKGRNEAFHEGKSPNPWSTLTRANDYANHREELNPRTSTQVPPFRGSKVWRPPITGTLKINSDIKFNKTEKHCLCRHCCAK